jgi:hypothetical protein
MYSLRVFDVCDREMRNHSISTLHFESQFCWFIASSKLRIGQGYQTCSHSGLIPIFRAESGQILLSCHGTMRSIIQHSTTVHHGSQLRRAWATIWKCTIRLRPPRDPNFESGRFVEDGNQYSNASRQSKLGSWHKSTLYDRSEYFFRPFKHFVCEDHHRYMERCWKKKSLNCIFCCAGHSPETTVSYTLSIGRWEDSRSHTHTLSPAGYISEM